MSAETLYQGYKGVAVGWVRGVLTVWWSGGLKGRVWGCEVKRENLGIDGLDDCHAL